MKSNMLKICTVFLCVVMVFSFAACGNNSSSTPTTPEETKATEATKATVEPASLSFLFAQSNLKDFMTVQFKKFEAENKGYTIDIQTIPDNQWLEVLKTKLAVNETPDVGRINVSQFELINADENFVEIDSSVPWVSRIIPSVLTSKQYKGKLYGVPIGSDTAMGILYNNDVFKKYGVSVPKTYEELLAACETFKKNNVTPVFATDKDTWTTQIWFTCLAPQLVPADTWDKIMTNKAKWTDYPEFVDAQAKLLELHQKGYTNKDAIATTYDSEAKALSDGSTAMTIMGQWIQGDILKINPNADIRLAPIPVGPAKLTLTKGGGVIAIFKNSSKVEQAKVFLDWFAKAENMNTYCEGWTDSAMFVDQTELKLTPLQKDIQVFIDAGNVEYEMNPRIAPIDPAELWNFEQGMVAGMLSPKEVMEKWQVSFEKQAQLKKIAGF